MKRNRENNSSTAGPSTNRRKKSRGESDMQQWQRNPFLRLNDDCIRHIGTFLDKSGLVSLQHTNSRFLHMKVPPFEFNGWNSSSRFVRFRDNKHSYKAICPMVTSLNIDPMWLIEDLDILPMFTNLQELYLDSEEISPGDEEYRKWIDCIPDGIKKITLRGDFICTDTNMPKLFKRLNPTLEFLDLETNYPRVEAYAKEIKVINLGLDKLRNIEYFRCDDLGICSRFNRFAKNNRYSITHLVVAMRWHHNIWKEVTAMENLKYLHISFGQDGPDSRVPLQIGGHSSTVSLALPCLKELCIRVTQKRREGYQGRMFECAFDEEEKKARLKFLKGLDGTELQVFHFDADPRGVKMSIFKRMTNLVELSLKKPKTSGDWPTLIPGLLVLTELKELTVQGLKEDDLLPLIKGLPKLEEITIPRKVKYSGTTINKAREYLQEANRDLLFNNQNLQDYEDSKCLPEDSETSSEELDWY